MEESEERKERGSAREDGRGLERWQGRVLQIGSGLCRHRPLVTRQDGKRRSDP